MPAEDYVPFLRDVERWLHDQTLTELISPEEVSRLLAEVRADDGFWEDQRPRFERTWERALSAWREERRSPADLLQPAQRDQLLDGLASIEPDPQTVSAFLRSPAVEAMMGEILYNGISEFLRRADLLGRVINKLPVLGGIRRRISAAFKEEVEGRLEGQIKGFLGSFSGRAVERMIQYVLAPEHQDSFRQARRRALEELLKRPLQELAPGPEADRWREQAWQALREAPLADEQARIAEIYADWGQDRLGQLLIAAPEAGHREVARLLAGFLESESGQGWRLGPTSS